MSRQTECSFNARDGGIKRIAIRCRATLDARQETRTDVPHGAGPRQSSESRRSDYADPFYLLACKATDGDPCIGCISPDSPCVYIGMGVAGMMGPCLTKPLLQSDTPSIATIDALAAIGATA